jgi:hypothetical protein
MFKVRYLQRHGNTWLFTLRVPCEQRPAIGKREILRSLGSDYRAAQRLVVLETAKAHARLDCARRQLEADPEREAALSETEIFDSAR